MRPPVEGSLLDVDLDVTSGGHRHITSLPGWCLPARAGSLSKPPQRNHSSGMMMQRLMRRRAGTMMEHRTAQSAWDDDGAQTAQSGWNDYGEANAQAYWGDDGAQVGLERGGCRRGPGRLGQQWKASWVGRGADCSCADGAAQTPSSYRGKRGAGGGYTAGDGEYQNEDKAASAGTAGAESNSLSAAMAEASLVGNKQRFVNRFKAMHDYIANDADELEMKSGGHCAGRVLRKPRGAAG
ncbi:hypothetical protein SKAU_G00374790 [Synaphobranchus kaupii]|uniref:Uncharacterized protein n=1 Tax=Synaphobranchus kaupii TaxID=118154 RepID=A0A9Q1EGR3_SYNKA|nr:hypothetical protein SKAU_G00374790 [Synaphobranchus kaupii]